MGNVSERKRCEMNKEIDNKIRSITKEINKDSANVELILERARLYEQVQDYNKCVKDYELALNIDGDNAEIYLKMGIICEKDASVCVDGFWKKEEKYDEAYDYYSKAIDLSRDNKKLYIHRGNLLRDVFEEDEEALEDYLRAYKIDNKDYVVCKLIAETYYLIDDSENSIRFYKKVIEMNKEDVSSIEAIADIYQELEEYEEAIQYYNRIIDKVDNTYSICFDIGICYFRLKDYKKALNQLEQCNVSQRDYIYYFIKGEIYEELGKYNDALIEYDKSLSLKEEAAISDKKEVILNKLEGMKSDGKDK